MLNESGLVYKYFDLIDGFIRVRMLSEKESLNLPQSDAGPPDRREYRALVVAACVEGLQERVIPRVQEMYPDDSATAEDLLYQICVDVNPRLEIHSVVLPAEAEAEAAHATEPAKESDFRDRAEALEGMVLSEVFGQDDHVAAVCRAVRKAGAGLNDPLRPVGSFLLVGRTGVGKTELAKSLANNLFGEDSLIRVDCSEFGLPHETAKLIGAPPGYIGHGEGGMLTEALQKNPNAVVLFDEIEKGHEKLHDMLLQILDDGRLTDSKGQTVSFRNALVLLTSNVGTADYAAAKNRVGFGQEEIDKDAELEQLTSSALRSFFKPEMLNRLDGIRTFGALDHTAGQKIVNRQLQGFADRMRNAGVELRWSKALCRKLAEFGLNEEYGARELRRILARMIEEPASDAILDGRWQAGDCIRARWQKGAVVLQHTAPSLSK